MDVLNNWSKDRGGDWQGGVSCEQVEGQDTEKRESSGDGEAGVTLAPAKTLEWAPMQARRTASAVTGCSR